VIFDVHTAVMLKRPFFWDVTLCHWASILHHFVGSSAFFFRSQHSHRNKKTELLGSLSLLPQQRNYNILPPLSAILPLYPVTSYQQDLQTHQHLPDLRADVLYQV